MTVSVDDIAARFERELGSSWVSVDEPSRTGHAVDGVRPRVVCRPADADQIATVLRLCGEAGAAVTAWGGGTAIALGNIPHRVDVVLRLERLGGLVEHDDANLTATVQAGMPVSALNEHLTARRQFLALDPPRPDAATIGGVVAASTNGPRRMSYGGVRDLVIGMRVVLAGGEQIKAGGKVVKNVAGYDMCKLFTGSLGTLGIITEVTFKMAPQPEAAATVLARGARSQAMRVVDDLFASVLQPAAITVSNVLADLPGGATALAVAAEGFEEAVDRHLRDSQTYASDAGMTVEVLRGADHDALWARFRDFPGEGLPASPADGVIRLTVPLGSGAAALGAMEKLPGSVTWVAHAASGVIFVRMPAAGTPEALSLLAELARTHRGHAVLIAAPPEVKRGRDVWGPPPPALNLMREIKRQFDPNSLLNPGRFVAFL